MVRELGATGNDGRRATACDACRREARVRPRADGTAKLPPKWKQVGEARLCPACYGQRYVVRALTVPIARVVDGEWGEFAKACHETWRSTTHAANVCLRLFAAGDPPTPPDAKIEPWTPPADTYGRVRELLPDLASGSVSALCQEWGGKYRAARLEMHMGRRSLPTARYPQPLPLRAQDIALAVAEVDGAGRLAASFRTHSTAAEASRRWRVTLGGGPGFARNLRLLRSLLAGESDGEITSATLDAIAARGRDGQHVPTRDRSGNRQRLRPVLRVICRLPRRASSPEAVGVLEVQTGTAWLLRWRVEGDAEWRPPLWMEHVRRRVEFWALQQARLRDDLKREKRWPAEVRRQITGQQDRHALARRNMMRSVCQQAAHHVVGYARRRQCGAIAWDNAAGVVRGVPPAQLLEAVRQAAEAEGLTVTHREELASATSAA